MMGFFDWEWDMKALVCAVVLGLTAGPVWAQTNNAEAPAPRCLEMSKITSLMDPVRLTRDMLVCIEEGQTDNAVDLYNVAGAFARFDSLRVSDKSAHSAYPALKAQVAEILGEQKSAEFSTQIRERSGSPGYHETLCTVANTIQPPNYEPTYMTRHGMGAFTGAPQMVEDFNAIRSWDEVRTSYLKCPAPGV